MTMDRMSTASREPADPAYDDLATSPSVRGLSEVAGHWGLVLAYGVLCVLVGLLLIVWPDETVTVFAVLIAVQLLVAGVLRIVLAIGARGLDGGVRVLMALTGGLSLVVGLLCLRDPVQTLLFIGILVGMWCLLVGIVDVVAALVSPMPGRRAFDVITGVISILVGGFLIVNPHLSLGLFVLVISLLLLVTGGVAVLTAVRMRGHLHHDDPAAAGATALPTM
jgi:uncharacterized membrane protein HdeD (DUF308 family)